MLHPRYIPVYCLTPPTIEHARHSALPEQATFDLDSTVQYHCHTGYVTAGFPRSKCLAIEGKASWYGPDIQCERKRAVQKYNMKPLIPVCGQQLAPVANRRIRPTDIMPVNVIRSDVALRTIATKVTSWLVNWNDSVRQTDHGRRKNCPLVFVSISTTANYVNLKSVHNSLAHFSYSLPHTLNLSLYY